VTVIGMYAMLTTAAEPPVRAEGELMARIPYPDPDAAPEPVREALAALPQLNIFRMIAHAESAFRPFLRFGMALLTQSMLDPRLRELVILRVAALSGARYEWIQHEQIALALGVTADQVAAIEAGDLDSKAISAAERTVLLFTTEAVAEVRVSDTTFAATAALLAPRALVELLLTIGQYMMLARVMETLELELDEPRGTEVIGSEG
jgi:AhpD family alkylhydroperoxidase